ncbi:MAG TPA: hypothetical protein VFL41_13925 [Gaiellaceae bacterium]|nr:hypothetical protein [Gaiellaceae bacterium]
MAPLDAWLPEYHVREHHAIVLTVPPDKALEIVLALPAAPDWIVRLLIAGRGMAARRETLENRARRAFRAYWLVVGPFSALIRRRWLAAAMASAKRSAAPSA